MVLWEENKYHISFVFISHNILLPINQMSSIAGKPSEKRRTKFNFKMAANFGVALRKTHKIADTPFFLKKLFFSIFFFVSNVNISLEIKLNLTKHYKITANIASSF